MKAAEFRKKSEKDMVKLLAELRGQMRNLRFKIAAKEVKNHQELKKVKRDIARILTIFKEGKKVS